MNVLHLRYAVEVEKNGSISGAAEKLFMGQPNLSKAIRELENTIGISLFTRTTKGVTATPQGKEFLHAAKHILAELDQMENQYVKGLQSIQRFSVSVPRASYMAHAFSRFVKKIALQEEIEFHFKETNTMRAIGNMLKHDFRLGVIRYPLQHQAYYENLLYERGMVAKEIWTYAPCLLFSEQSPLARKTLLTATELDSYIEIAHGDQHMPSTMPQTKSIIGTNPKKILIYERGSQFELLRNIPNTYMWVSPLPESLLARHGLVQRAAHDEPQYYKDVFIYQSEYHLTELDNLFLEELLAVKQELTVLL